MNSRIDEILQRLEDIEKERKELRVEQIKLYETEIKNKFTWDLLSKLKWHIVYPNAESICIRSIFKGDLREWFFSLQRKTKCYEYDIVVNGFEINIGSQGLVIMNLNIKEFYDLYNKLKIVAPQGSYEKEMMQKTIEYLTMLSKLPD